MKLSDRRQPCRNLAGMSFGATKPSICSDCQSVNQCLEVAVAAEMRNGDWGDNAFGGLDKEQRREASENARKADGIYKV